MEHWNWYATKHLAMVPYMPGTPVYKDGVTSTLYYQTRDQGLIRDTFCGDTKNHDQFVFFFESLKTMQCLCEVTDGDKLKIVGYSWVQVPRGVDGARSAQCAMCFFEGSEKVSRDLARLALGYAFIALKIDVLHGIQVESNYAARNFSARLGFKTVAHVPNYHVIDSEFHTARVMMLAKDEFAPPFLAWKETQD